VAVTQLIRIGRSEAIVRSTIRISNVKTSPAIGALKMPAMAADAPQPTRTINFLLSRWNNCPRLLPMALPVSTIGASAPTLPPKPMVILDAMTDDQQLCPLSFDLFVARAYRTLVIPCEMLSRTIYFMKSDVR